MKIQKSKMSSSKRKFIAANKVERKLLGAKFMAGEKIRASAIDKISGESTTDGKTSSVKLREKNNLIPSQFLSQSSSSLLSLQQSSSLFLPSPQISLTLSSPQLSTSTLPLSQPPPPSSTPSPAPSLILSPTPPSSSPSSSPHPSSSPSSLSNKKQQDRKPSKLTKAEKEIQEEVKTIAENTRKYFEKYKECEWLIGCDESGAGAWSHDVTICAFALRRNSPLIDGVCDSKKVCKKTKKACKNKMEIFKKLTRHPNMHVIVSKDCKVIDEINILEARKLAFTEAANQLVAKIHSLEKSMGKRRKNFGDEVNNVEGKNDGKDDSKDDSKDDKKDDGKDDKKDDGKNYGRDDSKIYEIDNKKDEKKIGENNVGKNNAGKNNTSDFDNADANDGDDKNKIIVLIDGNVVPDDLADKEKFKYKAKYKIRGDQRFYPISAASIIAKITRDKQMKKMAKLYPQYDFENNVGYHSKKHIKALEKFGTCPIHRLTFKPMKDNPEWIEKGKALWSTSSSE